MSRFPNIYKTCYKTSSKVGCFAGFCHHRVTTMSAHTHAYFYPLFESDMSVNNRFMQERYKTNSKVDFLQQLMYCWLCQLDNQCIIAYVETITDVRYDN